MSCRQVLTEAGYIVLGGLIVVTCILAAYSWCWIAQAVAGWIG